MGASKDQEKEKAEQETLEKAKVKVGDEAKAQAEIEAKNKAEAEAKKKADEEAAKKKADDEAVKSKETKKEEGTQEETEKAKAASSDLATALLEFIPWLKKMAAMQGAPKDAIDKIMAYLGEVKPTPVKKEGEGSTEVPPIQIMADGSILLSGKPISKGKTFTDNRINAIKEIMRNLGSFLGEVSEDALKDITSVFSSSFKPDLSSQVRPAPAVIAPVIPAPAIEVAKSAGNPELVGKLDELLKGMKDLSGRVETIEKIREPSKSIADQGGTDSKNKVNKSLWNGVL